MTLSEAYALLSLPRAVGAHPETGDLITAAIGRFGPYLKYQERFVSLKKEDDVLTIDLDRAITHLAEAASKPKSVRPSRKKKS